MSATEIAHGAGATHRRPIPGGPATEPQRRAPILPYGPF